MKHAEAEVLKRVPSQERSSTSVRDETDTVPVRLIPRRRFIRDSAAIAGVVGGLAVGVGPAAAQNTDGISSADPVRNVQTLSEAELTTLRAVVDRIFPADEYGPSATACGVDVYIQNSLAGWLGATLPLYNAGLAALDAAAGSGGFAGLAEADQDALVTELEAGQLADAPEGFWGMLLEHARQGMFCDPKYGGNKDFAGWDLINFPGVKLVWTAEDQAQNSPVKPEHVSVAEFQGAG
jgi:hypothetical protein